MQTCGILDYDYPETSLNAALECNVGLPIRTLIPVLANSLRKKRS
jgi:hypothetical protein